MVGGASEADWLYTGPTQGEGPVAGAAVGAEAGVQRRLLLVGESRRLGFDGDEGRMAGESLAGSENGDLVPLSFLPSFPFLSSPLFSFSFLSVSSSFPFPFSFWSRWADCASAGLKE